MILERMVFMKKMIKTAIAGILLSIAMASIVFAQQMIFDPFTIGPLQYWESGRIEFTRETTHQGKITYGQVSAAGDTRISIYKNMLVLPVEEAYRNIFVTVSSKGLTYNLPFGSISAGKNHAYRVRNYDSANYTVTSFKDTW